MSRAPTRRLPCASGKTNDDLGIAVRSSLKNSKHAYRNMSAKVFKQRRICSALHEKLLMRTRACAPCLPATAYRKTK